MMQQTAVALIVLAALAFAAWRFMPARWRRPLAVRLAARLGLRPRAATPGGCSGCQGCARANACGATARQQLAAQQRFHANERL